ncbi:uncharacterized protein DUF4859 [Mucilaginibacter oryzae]|uniref:Uncharacterized protein DUF4859 n=1 Tax=Mucilaginibacter oryzae TaxID=468058 RepID=A0A316HC73_9SPHI|nr:DUF4859 domain-containing protein [Mucilaginibacter oryzae]PWK78724.1 uncharacterized protein DUF4859 [Mucilaginibacter oryzae]
MKKTLRTRYINTLNIRALMWFIIPLLSVIAGCSKKANLEEPTKVPPVINKQDSLSIYIPKEFKQLNFNDSTSTWNYRHSKQSEHFIVFWDLKYGSDSPNSAKVPSQYRVDIDDLLQKAELFYQMNINTLKFADVEKGKSNLAKYKMLIFLYYEDQWRATGAGYDDVIGALWISPAAVKPVGSVLAHEIGHCFQYQIFCDEGGSSGFRYGFGDKPGNAFWEQTAQWQSFQSYPSEVFTTYDFGVYLDNCHRHINHEDMRYASYFIHYYWASKHGIDIIGKIWRQALKPEDPIQAYMRITGINTEQLNDEIYDGAAKFVTWDLDALRDLGANYIGRQPYEFDKLSDGSFQVKYTRCPGTTGYNIVPLKVPASGTVINAQFTGLPNASGYNHVDASVAGWRYGYVALLNNGTRVYSPMSKGITGQSAFTVPANCSKIWFVVTGAPSTYAQHAWDDDNTNDEQWPYKVKFTNTTLFNDFTVEPGTKPKDITFNINVKVPFDAVNYSRSTVTVDLEQLTQALTLTPKQITEGLDSKVVKFYAVESNGNLNAQTTANGYGHWFNAAGNVINWGNDAKVFSEMDAAKLTFDIGQFPNHVSKNDHFDISQALVYEYEPGKKVQATFKFSVTIE